MHRSAEFIPLQLATDERAWDFSNVSRPRMVKRNEFRAPAHAEKFGVVLGVKKMVRACNCKTTLKPLAVRTSKNHWAGLNWVGLTFAGFSWPILSKQNLRIHSDLDSLAIFARIASS